MIIPWVTALIFWLGQIKLGITIINKYIVFLRDSIAKHILTIGFGVFMTAWPIVLFVLYRDTVFTRHILSFHPSGILEYMLLVGLLYGVFLLIQANARALARFFKNPLPEGVNRIAHKRYTPAEGAGWKMPRLPLFLQYPLHFFNDYYTVELNIFEITFEDLPSSFDGFRVAHITDMHYDTRLDFRFYEFCVSETNALAPDLVLVTGDNISRQRYSPKAFGILTDLKAPEGVYILRGNHDFWQDAKTVKSEILVKGLGLLDNRSVTITRDGDTLRIVGVEHPWKRLRTWDEMLLPRDQVFTICATHTPDNFRRAAKAGAALTLCGHTHGGQVRVPFFGPVVCPSKFSRRYDQGFFRIGKSYLYVNRGIGSTVPFRMRCPSEIALFILRKR